MGVLSWLFSFIQWITALWSKMPDATKERIINAVVDAFENVFRDYYQASRKKKRGKLLMKFKEYLAGRRAGRPEMLHSGSSEGPSLIQAAKTNVARAIRRDFLTTTAQTLSTADVLRLQKGIAEIVTSDSFLTDLSEKVGEPRGNETEDAFVRRAKTEMRSLLRKSLGR